MSKVSRTYGSLHFEDLDPKRFEDLVRQLTYDFRPWRMLEATGRSGSDDGFDVRGYEIIDATDNPNGEDIADDEANPETANDRKWLIQCKREKKITPGKLILYLNDIPENERKSLHGIIFVAACDFSKKSYDAFRLWCSQNAISECHLWGKPYLEDLLFQPKNDHLLFAYFGISIQIRRRSIRTSLRAKLSMKKKSERVLGKGEDCNKLILMRDPTDDKYPYKKKGERYSWRPVHFSGHEPTGIKVDFHKHFAYVADDGISWDYFELIDDGLVRRQDNPWSDETDHDPLRDEVWRFWYDLPEKNRAWFTKFGIMRYEDIIDIDDEGDHWAPYPHVFIQRETSYNVGTKITFMGRWKHPMYNPDENKRVKFFPDTFPKDNMEE